MNGLVKKVLAGLAIKEGIEKIQEMRQPRRSFTSRIKRPLLLLGLAGGVVYLQQTGKLGPMIQQAKGLTGSKGGSSTGITSNGHAPSMATSSSSV
ncbi:MAG: hypothetical protein QOH90_1422 [Actinomycetota bacterium]|jgi:hypothetical protein|nr:hypothetical protein [Actinomycetota bacterium]